MSNKVLTENEKAALRLILDDLQVLSSITEIASGELDDFTQRLKSMEAKSYTDSLRQGAKPETALRESFFAGKSIISKYFFGEISPEVNLGPGFIDYLIKGDGRPVLLELKPLLEAKVEEGKAGKVLRKIERKELKIKDHKEQILKYLRRGYEYIILTNLQNWFFFNKECSPAEFKFFLSLSLSDFCREYDVVGDLRDFLSRKEFQSIREDLDRKFFDDLKAWVGKLSEVEFSVNGKRKIELIIRLVNKFIFIQTLDDYGVVDFNWVMNTWEHFERRWHRKGKLQVLERFLREVDEWFYRFYDTELFRGGILEYVVDDQNNIERFHRNLQLVLGLAYWQTALGGFRGIMQYNFRHIDEDILGKAYETFLAEVRREEGIYYTPKPVTQYIVSNTVGRLMLDITDRLKHALEKENFDVAGNLLNEFVSIKVMDPACGSGSFLIKTVREIFAHYKSLDAAFRRLETKYNKWEGGLVRSKEIEHKVKAILQLRGVLGPRNDRDMISRVLIRHIHGNDLDKKALDVAKVNIWLEAIKLAPAQFRYDKLPKDTNCVLPNLEMNLCSGDSLVGLPEDIAISYLLDNHKKEIIELSKLRREYLTDPSNPMLVERVVSVKRHIREELDSEFARSLEEENLPEAIMEETKPFHWPLDFWYLYFSDDGDMLPLEIKGVDAVIGNPPYINIRQMSKAQMDNQKAFYRSSYKAATGFYDIFVLFIEKALFSLLKDDGMFGFIISNKLLTNDYGETTRKMILSKSRISKIIDVSMLNVFEEAQIYPIILVCQKVPEAADSEENIVHMVTATSLDNIGEGLNVAIKQSELRNFKKSVIPIPTSPRSFEMLRKITDRGALLGELCTLNSGTAGFQYRRFGDCLVADKPRHKRALPFIVTGNLDHYHIDFTKKVHYLGRELTGPYLVFDEEKITKGKWELFNKEKIVIRGMALSLTAAYDEIGVATGVSTYLVTGFKEKKIDPFFLTALLNSKVLDFYYKTLFLSKHLSGEWIGYNVSQLEGLPIVVPKQKEQEKIASLVRKEMILRDALSTFIKIWQRWSVKLKNSEMSLADILKDDLAKLRKGRKDIWTAEASIYPNKHEEQNNLLKFDVSMQGDVLRILGLTDERKETTLLTLRFQSDDLLIHTYFAIIQALESGLRIEALDELLTKTKVPLIFPNYVVNTPNIIKHSIDDYEGQKKEKILVPSILSQLKETEAQIEAKVFLLYGLQKEEVEFICESLSLNESHKLRILEAL